MRKRIVLLVALCATTMSLAACHNTETTNMEVTGTPAAQEEVKGDSNSNEKMPTKNDATVEPTIEPTIEPTTEPTIEPTTTPTAKPTVPLTEAPVVSTKVEVSWEESGMSYELFENPDGTVAVIVTNNGDTTYNCYDDTNKINITLEPKAKWYSLFSNIDATTNFTTALENVICKTQGSTVCTLTTEAACTVTNKGNYGSGSIEFKSDDFIRNFNKNSNLNITFSDYMTAEGSGYLLTYNIGFGSYNYKSGIIVVYGENNEIVTITNASTDVVFNETTEEYAVTGKFTLPSDLEYSKVTMVMQYTWADGIFE